MLLAIMMGMPSMWNLFRMELKYEVYSNINYFFRFIKNLGPFKDKFSDEFHNLGLKGFASGFSGIYKVLKSILSGILAAFVALIFFTAFNNVFSDQSVVHPGIMASFFVVLYFFMNLMQPKVLGATQKIHLFHQVFRQNARDVARVELFITPALQFIGRSAGFLIIFPLVAGTSPLQAIWLSFILATLGTMIEWIHLKFLDLEKPLQGNPVFIIVVLVILSLSLLLVSLLKVDGLMILWNPIAWILVPVLFFVFFLANWNYKNYNQVAQHIHREYEKQLNLKLDSQARTMDVQLKDSDYDKLRTNQEIASLSGYAKLNALFFDRHKRILRKPIMIFTYIGIVLGVGGLIFLWFNRTLNIWHPFKIGVFYDSLSYFIPFYMYLSIGDKRLTKSLFVNCDASLLTYSFYRRPEDVLTSYRMRLKEVIKLNAPPPLALIASLAIWLFLSGMAITPDRLILFPLIIAYYVFFTIHLLFIYYILQPYTQDVAVKSPLYTVINFAVYMFCYMPLFIKPDMTKHAIFIISLTIIYALAARVLIPRLTPQTFRLK